VSVLWEPQNDEAQKEALRRFRERERSQPVTFKLWHLFVGGALLGLAAWWVFTKIYEAVQP